MLPTYVFSLFSTISLMKVDFVGVSRICFIPKILDSDDVNMLELSRIVTKYIIESNSELEDVNNHLYDLCKTNDNFDGLLTCYKGYITDLSRYLLINSCHAAYKNKETYQLLKSFELLCECIKSGKYKSFFRDVCQLMFDYEQLLKVSAITKKFVAKTYFLENLTACLCKFLGFREEYGYILVCDITFFMHQYISCIMLAQNIEDLNNIIAKQNALDFCIELVIDEAQLLNIIYDFEYKKHNPSAVKEIDAASAANFTFDKYLKSMFPELTTPNRFANIIYMPWTDIDEKINFFIRHAKHNVLRECSKQCFLDRLTTIKNYFRKILLDNKVLQKAEDKPTRHIIAFRSRVDIF